MKTVNIALTKEAHNKLKSITDSTMMNQSDVMSFILENIDTEKIIKEIKI